MIALSGVDRDERGEQAHHLGEGDGLTPWGQVVRLSRRVDEGAARVGGRAVATGGTATEGQGHDGGGGGDEGRTGGSHGSSSARGGAGRVVHSDVVTRRCDATLGRGGHSTEDLGLKSFTTF